MRLVIAAAFAALLRLQKVAVQRMRCTAFRPLAKGATFAALACLSFHAEAATYHVDANARDDSGDGSAERPKKRIASGLALLSKKGGDVLVIAPGVYGHPRDAIKAVPSGRPDAYNVVKAATDGTTIIQVPLVLPNADHYVQFEGLKWDYPNYKGIRGRYVKILRCAFKGGGTTGNTSSVVIGTNDFTPGAQYILIEDSWVYGPGGRYKLLVYNSDSVVIRRVVVRHDGGWIYDRNNPQGGITVYNSNNVRLQDVMAIDGLLGLEGFESNIYFVGNDSSKTPTANVRVQGAIVIGGAGNGIAFDDHRPYENASVEDVVVWGTAAGGFASGGSAHQVTIDRALIRSKGTAFADWAYKGGIRVKNSIAYGNAKVATAVQSSHLYAFDNAQNNGGTPLDPLTNGLKYLPRVEKGSKLMTMGEGGHQVGPQIVKRVGVSGTLFGEAGFEDVTKEDLWPWPNEQRIKADFAEDIARGFAATDKSLTHYVWEQLGKPMPSSF
jgi:hypothetical protein